jgi:hypothetical protein
MTFSTLAPTDSLLQVPCIATLSGDFRQKERAMAIAWVIAWVSQKCPTKIWHRNRCRFAVDQRICSTWWFTPGAKALFAILEDADADIICLQEVHR